ncbi:DUF2917 domain-containing protein [Acidovorax sp. JHL-9]|uniref:DUF2917 domain-containing protein n=1 Tax=Acidovorax sp. JHL-9 TaxID=1276756 RepID=UPI0003FC7FE2|nr:DUF2917 domain-containing protein [Acidovorax sp. JHL-9]
MSIAIPLSASAVLSDASRVPARQWKLPAGRALSLYPRERGVLEITLGRAWVTQSGARCASTDHVLAVGERLVLEPGRHVVIEPWAGPGWPAAAFRWEAAALVRAPADWERGVAQPARELAQALAGAGRAAVRVATGFAAWAGRGGAPCGG